MLSIPVTRAVVFHDDDLFDMLSHGFEYLSWGHAVSGPNALGRLCKGDDKAVVVVEVTQEGYPGDLVRWCSVAELKHALDYIAQHEPSRFDRLARGQYDIYDVDVLLQRWILNGHFFA